MVRLSRQDWLAIIGLLLTVVTLLFAGGAWVYGVVNERLNRVEQSDISQNARIRSNEKEAEFAGEKFTELKEAIRDIGENIQELRKDLNK